MYPHFYTATFPWEFFVSSQNNRCVTYYDSYHCSGCWFSQNMEVNPGNTLHFYIKLQTLVELFNFRFWVRSGFNSATMVPCFVHKFNDKAFGTAHQTSNISFLYHRLHKVITMWHSKSHFLSFNIKRNVKLNTHRLNTVNTAAPIIVADCYSSDLKANEGGEDQCCLWSILWVLEGQRRRGKLLLWKLETRGQ